MTSYLDRLNLRPFEKRLVVGVGAVLFLVLNAWFVVPHFSDLGQAEKRPTDAIEKLEPKLLFEITDLTGQGGLGNVQLLRRRGDGAKFRHCDERPHVPKVHENPLCWIGMNGQRN